MNRNRQRSRQFLVPTAVRFIDDHQIEVPHPEAFDALGVFGLDEVHHRGVGGEEHPPLAALVGHQVDGGAIGQEAAEGSLGLEHEGGAIGEDQHPLDPVAAGEHIGE